MDALTTYKRDVAFIVDMAHKYPSFRIPSWYWRPPHMSAKDMEEFKVQQAKSNGYYKGIGVISKRSYNFIKELDSDTVTVTLRYRDSENITITIPYTDLYRELEQFISVSTKSHVHIV